VAFRDEFEERHDEEEEEGEDRFTGLHRGTSLIRKRHPPMTFVGPQA